MAAALLLAGAVCGRAAAQEYRFSVPEVRVVLTVQTDASVTVEYRMRFENRPGAHAIDVVDIGMPNKGYEVISAFDGKEALKKVKERAPDLIVLDIMMPYMDGFEVLKQLQANPDTRGIPVIMLTAKAQDADVYRGWASGVSAYLTKPFNPLELLTFVKRIFSGYDEYSEEDKTWEV